MAKLVAKIGSIKLFSLILVSIFFVELLIMFLLERYLTLDYFSSGLVDSLLLTISLFPILYFFVFKPIALKNARYQELTRNLEKSESLAKKTLADAERFNKLMVGRELKMVKLKKEIMELKARNN